MISELLRLSFNQVSEAILLILADGSVCEVNSAAVKLLGYSKEQLLQKTIFDLLPKFNLTHWEGLKYNQKILYMDEVTLANQQKQAFEVHAEYCKNKLGEGASLIIKPIQNQVALVQKEVITYPEHLLELIINNLPQQIFWKDCNQVYLGCNRHFAEVVGLDHPTEVIGKNDYQLRRNPKYADAYREWDRRVIETGEAVIDLEEEYYDADGTEGTVLTSKVPLIDEQGSVFGLVGISSEITKIKKIQEQLIETNQKGVAFNEQLEVMVEERTQELHQKNEQLKSLEIKLREALATEKEINQFKTNIITTISHEYRTPLSRILIAARLLKNYYAQLSPEKREKYLGEICSAVQYLSNIVNDIIALNRIPSQNRPVKFANVNLVAIYQMAVANLKDSQTINHKLQLDHTEDEIWINGDQALLRRLMYHFLVNALQYSPQGSTIITRLRREENQIILEVIDQGIGIPLADRKQLFESFYRGSNVSNTRGMGLGLSIIKDIAKIHEAEVSVNSELGQGTIFTIRFPLPSQSTQL